eukprot:5164770-Prymnesium_polylepis.1
MLSPAIAAGRTTRARNFGTRRRRRAFHLTSGRSTSSPRSRQRPPRIALSGLRQVIPTTNTTRAAGRPTRKRASSSAVPHVCTRVAARHKAVPVWPSGACQVALGGADGTARLL